MKKTPKHLLFSLTLLLFSFLFSECKKAEPAVANELIIGKWELRSSFNGLSGSETKYLAGNGNELRFTTNTYEIYSNGKISQNGQYQIAKVKSVLSGEMVDQIIYDNNTNSVHVTIKIQNNQLTYAVDAFDGPINIYERY
ncbi:hypothetical protein GS399_06615 [Pedobacter sp. HMF7647]|uniref:Lipocalin-like domain-containing protein n=1 Tax=Hufsiella arboris TaxID=2695275 RepID=A0A7K1Y891_9SPHI|nr:hypothetical protein [Hufsiella arboris]MXV50640.1 hypothetical protein [Hufsiella arboris]